MENNHKVLFRPIELPGGVVLKNRLVKSAMSDSLGDGCGNPASEQIYLYERWAEGGVAASIIGEVQGSPDYPEKPGNLVLTRDANLDLFRQLALSGSSNGTQLWLQLGHAGAMAYPPISSPKGPSALNINGLRCDEMSEEEINKLPAMFANTAKLAEELGFGGVQIHAAHGFLLSQFLSPLFNQRKDQHGGSIQSRMRLLLDVVDEVCAAVSAGFVVAIKINSSDQLDGGLQPDDALEVVSALDSTNIDLIDISGGTYFPGAKSASDSAGTGAYFIDFASRARVRTKKPLMVTGGFKTHQQMSDAVVDGHTDFVGLARALVLDPALPNKLYDGHNDDLLFPRFDSPPEGGITAWYTMRLAELADGRETDERPDLNSALMSYEQRDNQRVALWRRRFDA